MAIDPLDLALRCEVCQSALDCEIMPIDRRQPCAEGTLYVSPCETCRDEAYDKGCEDGSEQAAKRSRQEAGAEPDVLTGKPSVEESGKEPTDGE